MRDQLREKTLNSTFSWIFYSFSYILVSCIRKSCCSTEVCYTRYFNMERIHKTFCTTFCPCICILLNVLGSVEGLIIIIKGRMVLV